MSRLSTSLLMLFSNDWVECFENSYRKLIIFHLDYTELLKLELVNVILTLNH